MPYIFGTVLPVQFSHQRSPKRKTKINHFTEESAKYWNLVNRLNLKEGEESEDTASPQIKYLFNEPRPEASVGSRSRWNLGPWIVHTKHGMILSYSTDEHPVTCREGRSKGMDDERMQRPVCDAKQMK